MLVAKTLALVKMSLQTFLCVNTYIFSMCYSERKRKKGLSKIVLAVFVQYLFLILKMMPSVIDLVSNVSIGHYRKVPKMMPSDPSRQVNMLFYLAPAYWGQTAKRLASLLPFGQACWEANLELAKANVVPITTGNHPHQFNHGTYAKLHVVTLQTPGSGW